MFSTYWSSIGKEELYETRRLLQQGITDEPLNARCHALLGLTYLPAFVHRMDGDHANLATLERALDLARKAVQLEPNLPLAHATTGIVLLFKKEHDASIAEFERAVALNPNFSDWRFGLALM